MLQAVHCKVCNGAYLVGIDNKDIRKIDHTTSGKLGNDPYVGFDHRDTINVPWIREGDKIPCPHCSNECIVEEMTPVGDSNGTMSSNE